MHALEMECIKIMYMCRLLEIHVHVLNVDERSSLKDLFLVTGKKMCN